MASVAHSSNRVLIVGGGIAGLAAAVRLAQSGRAVTVFERSRLGSGASTRNQGWLHSGALFALDQPEIARLCRASLQATLEFCPECVEPGHVGSVFVLTDEVGTTNRWLRAWGEAGLVYKPIPPDQLQEMLPGLARGMQRAFLLPDRSIRMEDLLRRFVDVARAAGVEFRPATEITHLMHVRNRIYGAVTAFGEEIAANLVLLAANVRNEGLLPEAIGRRFHEAQEQHRIIALKSHLVSFEPAITSWPFCFPDLDGLNHLPHQSPESASVFGTNRWLPASSAADEEPVASDFERIREHVARLFPSHAATLRETAAWAGTTIQIGEPGGEAPTVVSRPTVIDHSRDADPVYGVLSLFPGRATLWPSLAEETLRVVDAALGKASDDVASPPWDTLAAASPAQPGIRHESPDVYHCQKCGRVYRKPPGFQPPVCCETVMDRVA